MWLLQPPVKQKGDYLMDKKVYLKLQKPIEFLGLSDNNLLKGKKYSLEIVGEKVIVHNKKNGSIICEREFHDNEWNFSTL